MPEHALEAGLAPSAATVTQTARAPERMAQAVDPAVRRTRLGVVLGLLVLFLGVVPVLGYTGVIADHDVNRLGRYLTFAILALGIDLIWGYTGILSLCQAFFFCLGGYAMAMHLSLPAGGGDVRPEYNNIPQFMFFNNLRELPAFWTPFASFWFALGAAILIPALVATVFGFFIFRSRVRGVYFAIITQAVAWGAFLAFSRNELLLGGTNGLTNFYKPFNQHLNWIVGLYLLTALTLVGAYLLCRFIVRSRAGRLLVAVRDKESRLYFAGYQPYAFKVFAFAVAAVLAGVGGALYAPQTGIITPNIMKVEDSIMMVIWVALGGRGRLWGAVFGALLVNYTYSALTSDLPTAWPFIQGAMFLAVVLLFPDGFVGLWDKLEARIAARAGALPIAALAVPLAAIGLFIIGIALGVMPRGLERPAFTLPSVGPLQWKYVLLVLTLLAAGAAEWGLSKRRATVSAEAEEGVGLPPNAAAEGGR